MALRQPTSLLASSSRLVASRTSFICASCTRQARHATTDAFTPEAPATPTPAQAVARVPKPTPFVPNAETFLKLIGRQLSSHASKFSSWEEMFTMSSAQLKARGLEPPRARKYFLRWREKFRRGDYGIGGDLTHVSNGTAELRVCEVPSLPTSIGSAVNEAQKGSEAAFASTMHTPGFTKLVLNVPQGAKTYQLGKGQKTTDLKKPQGVTLKEGHIIAGSYVMPLAGSNGSAATISVTEGMWEDTRGHKVHGGERRRAETLHKMRVAESKKARR